MREKTLILAKELCGALLNDSAFLAAAVDCVDEQQDLDRRIGCAHCIVKGTKGNDPLWLPVVEDREILWPKTYDRFARRVGDFDIDLNAGWADIARVGRRRVNLGLRDGLLGIGEDEKATKELFAQEARSAHLSHFKPALEFSLEEFARRWRKRAAGAARNYVTRHLGPGLGMAWRDMAGHWCSRVSRLMGMARRVYF